jgi:hypothetical protein
LTVMEQPSLMNRNPPRREQVLKVCRVAGSIPDSLHYCLESALRLHAKIALTLLAPH